MAILLVLLKLKSQHVFDMFFSDQDYFLAKCQTLVVSASELESLGQNYFDLNSQFCYNYKYILSW